MLHMCIDISIMTVFFIAFLLSFFFIVANCGLLVKIQTIKGHIGALLSLTFFFFGRLGIEDEIVDVLVGLLFVFHGITHLYRFDLVYAS